MEHFERISCKWTFISHFYPKHFTIKYVEPSTDTKMLFEHGWWGNSWGRLIEEPARAKRNVSDTLSDPRSSEELDGGDGR